MSNTAHIPGYPARKGRITMTAMRAAIVVALGASHLAAWPWGIEGHQLIASIAQSQLTPKTGSICFR